MAEGAGAAPAAALLSGRVPLARDQRTVFVLSGGNIDINRISRIIDRGLVADGRLIRLRVRMQDRPGSLARLAHAVAEEGANVLEIVHQRAFADISVGDVDLVMQLETRGRDHGLSIVRALEAQGLKVEEEL